MKYDDLVLPGHRLRVSANEDSVDGMILIRIPAACDEENPEPGILIQSSFSRASWATSRKARETPPTPSFTPPK